MGLFNFFKGDESSGRTIRVNEPCEGLKIARQYADNEQYDTAIDVLNQTYALMDEHGEPPTIDDRLRLPRYLYKAGRKSDAWGELNRLILAYGRDRTLGLLNLSKIHNAMRIQVEREKKFEFAIGHAVMAYIYQHQFFLKIEEDDGLPIDSDGSVLAREQSQIEKKLSSLLKKMQRTDLLQSMCSMVRRFVEESPKGDIAKLVRALETVLRETPPDT